MKKICQCLIFYFFYKTIFMAMLEYDVMSHLKNYL